MPKSWIEKLQEAKQPQLKRIEKKFADIPADSLMYISTPQEIDAYVRQIPAGMFVSPITMRKDLALDNKAEYTCPVTTGIFLRIVAEAAYEQHGTKAAKSTTPFWRAIDPTSALAQKLTFGTDFLKKMQEKEKIKIK